MTLSARRARRIAGWLKPSGARPFVLGHRGARHAAPENTLAAFELARREGADGVELDVRLDRDGRVIVLHDRTLARVSNQAETRDVELLGAADLDRVPVGSDRVPLLADVLAWARAAGMKVNVELKSDVSRPFALLTNVGRVVRASGLGPELVLFSSFHPGFVAALGVLAPDLPRAWLVDKNDRLFRRAPGFRLIADGVNPNRELVATAAMQRWQRRGAPIATWTVNAVDEARRVASLGVDTIISDCPGQILAGLAPSRAH
jgi:glycerophosphoryl diester phosphodiesterase